MAVRITPKSTQHTGMSLSTEGSVAAWEVTFHLDGDESLHAAISTFTLSAAVACNSRRRDSTVLQTESEEGSAIAFRSTCEFTSWPARYDTTRLPRQSLRRPSGRVRAPPTPHRLQLYRPRLPRSRRLLRRFQLHPQPQIPIFLEAGGLVLKTGGLVLKRRTNLVGCSTGYRLGIMSAPFDRGAPICGWDWARAADG